MPALAPDKLTAVLEALRTHRNATHAARIAGVNTTTAWRLAKKHGIALIPLSEHMKSRRTDPHFVARQKPAARKGASFWLKTQHSKPGFRKRSAAAARRNLKRLNSDPAFRQAASERLKRLRANPEFQSKMAAAIRAARRRRVAKLCAKGAEKALLNVQQLIVEPSRTVPSSRAASPRHRSNRGFAIAPILYLLGLIGVGAGVLFSGYSQILRSNQNMSNTLAAKNDLQGSATTLAASSWLSKDQTRLCPPMIGSGSPGQPSPGCSEANGAITIGTSFAHAKAGNLPAGYAMAGTSGSPVEAGVFAAGAGAKVLDPWGHYYVYCRWENPIGTSNALMIITAGANGKLETTCGDTIAKGDDLFVVWTTAVTQNHAAVWQTITSGTAVTGVQFGATGTQLNIDTAGDVTIPGKLGVTGPASFSSGLAATSGAFNAGVISTFATLSGMLTGVDANFSGSLSAGTASLSGIAITGDETVGGSVYVNGQGIKTSTGTVQIGTAVVATGSSLPLLTVGKSLSNIYPFAVDQYGAVAAPNFTGNLTGSQSGGSIAATTITTSDTALLGSTLEVKGAAAMDSGVNITGAATIGDSLTVGGTTSLNNALTGTSASFIGTVTAQSFVGNVSLGSGNGSVSLTGIVPIVNGGTGEPSAASALANLFGLAGVLPQMIPGGDLVNGSITSQQIAATGVTPGTYTAMTVEADGRITWGGLSASTNDGNGNEINVGTAGIVYSLGSSTIGNWTPAGLMVGSSSPALDKLDVYGGVAIGTGYAGTLTAPPSGLIVEGDVGIGTANPQGYALDVNGTLLAGNLTATGTVRADGTVTGTEFFGSGAGLTGIGTSNLTAVTGTPGSTTYLRGDGIWSSISGVAGGTANYVPLWTGATTLGTSAIYQSGGNVAIGTTNPQGYALDVNGSVAAAAFYGNGAGLTGIGTSALSGTIPTGNGGTGTNSQFTAGSVVFAGANGVYQQDNGNLFWNDSAAALGIGTGTPANALDVYTGGIHIGSSVPSSTTAALYNNAGALSWNGLPLATGGAGGAISGTANYLPVFTGTSTLGNSAIYQSGGNVAIGTTATSGALNVNGAISASGQIASTAATGTAPFAVASTTNVANLNASLLNGASFAAPGAIGGTTPGSGAFTTLSASGTSTLTGNVGLGTTSPANALDVYTGGGIHIGSGVPSSTTAALYNNAGALTWNGLALATSGAGGAISGAANYLPVFTGTSTLGNSAIYQNGGAVAIGTTATSGALNVNGTISASGQIASTAATGTAPFAVASTTNVANLNASLLNGATFAEPGAIGGTTPGSGAFTTLSASGVTTFNGSVGIGTSAPAATLDVLGSFYSRSVNQGGATAISFAGGNVQYTNAACGAFTLSNMQDGGAYTLVVTGSGAGPASFSYSGLTVKTGSTSLTCTTSSTTVFSFIRAGNYIYVAAISGY